MENKNSKKSAIATNLTSLISLGSAAEKKVSGEVTNTVSQENKNIQHTNEIQQGRGEEEKNTSADNEYASMFVQNPKFKEDKTVSAGLFSINQKRIKKLAMAEDSELVTVLNNIVDAFFEQNKKEYTKSIKKLGND